MEAHGLYLRQFRGEYWTFTPLHVVIQIHPDLSRGAWTPGGTCAGVGGYFGSSVAQLIKDRMKD